MAYVQCIHCPLSFVKTDAAAKGLAIEVTIGVRSMRVDCPNSNYPVKTNFTIEIMKVWTHRNA